MPKPPKKIPIKSVQASPEKTTADRVVTTHSESTLSVSYWNVIGNIPNCPETLLTQFDEAKANINKFAYKKFANSRDAASDGDAGQRFIIREQHFYDLATAGLSKFATTREEGAVLRKAIGLDQRSISPIVWKTAANPIYRLTFGKALASTLLDWAEHNKRDCYLITIINPIWHTSRANPKVDIAGMKAAVDQVLADNCWEGFLFMEIQGLRAQQKDLLPHFHGIIRPAKRNAKSIVEVRAALTLAFPDVELAEGVDLHLALSRSDVVNFLMYAAKSPSTIKRLYKSNVADSQYKTREGASNYSSRFALDILEVRSILAMSDLVYARGKTFARLVESVFSATESRLKALGITTAAPDFDALGKTWVAIRRRNPDRKVPSTYGKKRPKILR
ncbi:hypothetical protein GCM10010873_34040 [Cypionkella aquatica]|uniref:Uncharacterized protein n=1 Tax=Cypionkella aquatica TaxID=1756042 RepID=A0AA37X3K3_9RHOB|nr:hypothetical protein [Cypionkella aquatica]GLS88430.1 hypothetical protein GCM10010873_34040 [Cypionkella aquatica]